MFHLYVVETLAHYLLHAALLRRHAVLVLHALTAFARAGVFPRSLLIRLLYAGDAVALLLLLLLLLGLSVLAQLLLMLVKDTRREALEDPLVSEALIWRQPL